MVGAYDESSRTNCVKCVNDFILSNTNLFTFTGTSEERMAVLNAASKGGLIHIYDLPKPGKEDVFFKLRDIDKVMIGKKFQVIVDVENRSDEKRTVTSVLSASTVYYTGIIARKVKRARGTFTLKPRQSKYRNIAITRV